MSNPVQASELLKYDGVLGIGRGVRIRADEVTEEEVIRVYLSNRATIGTNMCNIDGTILVAPIRIGRGAMVGHLAMIGPGATLGKKAEIGVGVAWPPSHVGTDRRCGIQWLKRLGWASRRQPCVTPSDQCAAWVTESTFTYGTSRLSRITR